MEEKSNISPTEQLILNKYYELNKQRKDDYSLVTDLTHFDIKAITASSYLTIDDDCPDFINLTNNIKFREQQENNIACDKQSVVWINNNYSDCSDNLSKGFSALLQQHYALNAIKRFYIFNGEEIPENIAHLAQNTNNDYQLILNELSRRKAFEIANDLKSFADKLLKETDCNIFQYPDKAFLAKEAFYYVLNHSTLSLYQPHSLLNYITLNYNDFYNSTVCDINIYYNPPKTSDDFYNLVKTSPTPAFTNLLNTSYFLLYVRLYVNCTFKDKEYLYELNNRTLELYKKALFLNQEHYDFLPIITTLDRDLSTLLHYYHRNDISVEDQAKFNKTFTQPLDMYKAIRLKINKSNEHREENCATCVAAYELIRRGFRCQAQIAKDAPYVNLVAKFPNVIWQNHITKASPDILPIIDIEQLQLVCHSNERYHLMFSYLDTNNTLHGHVVTFEKNKEGQVVISDPQINNIQLASEYFSEQNSLKGLRHICCYRVDNCEPNWYFVSKILYPNSNIESI